MRLKVSASVVLVMLLVAVNPAEAGSIAEVEIGAGINYGSLSYDETMEMWDPGWAMGFTGGVLVEVPLAERVSFVPGLRFSSLKNKIELSGGYSGEFNVNHKYISVPILLRVDLSEDMFFLDAGPEFSLFISSEIQNDYTDPLDEEFDDTVDISDEIESYNIGLCLRVGFKAYRWDIPVAVTASYHHGFKGVADEDEWFSDWKTREFTFCVSYLFDLTE